MDEPKKGGTVPLNTDYVNMHKRLKTGEPLDGKSLGSKTEPKNTERKTNP